MADADENTEQGGRARIFAADDALAELDEFIARACLAGASRLLILAGKPVLCRIDGRLSDPLSPGRIHFSQTQRLVGQLLTPEQQAELDQDGEVEIDYSVKSTASQPSGRPGTFRIHVFFGDGAHNLVVFLQE